MDIVEEKGLGGWAKGLVDETRDLGKPLQTEKNRERMNGLGAKAIRFTSHFTAMHLAIQCSDDRVIPWQRA